LIDHVFVVMLENRSFDHLLGFSQIQGKDPAGNPTKIDGLSGEESNVSIDGSKVKVSTPADFALNYGPGHEFKDVREQLCGREGTYSSPTPQPGEIDPKINNSGYISNYSLYDRENPGTIMKCFSPEQLPVLATLAKEFALCDRWFSSMPGPTWPNRFFIHAGSSGGLDDSPAFSREFKSILYDGFKFENGTIFDELENRRHDWMIYCDDEFPQALSIAGMRKHSKRFKPFSSFRQDLSDPQFSKSYVFIEPDYHAFTGKFRGGNSQHPMDDMTRGDKLLKDVYEAIRNSPHWETSLLIITYDEHGGFCDHVVPPVAVSPGDSITDPSNNHNNFDFKQLGVRVPTVIISPLIPKGIIDHTIYDHTSVLATIEKLFGLGSLTKRDAAANSLNHLLKLDTPRNNAPVSLPDPAVSGLRFKEEEEEKKKNPITSFFADVITGRISLFKREPIDPSLAGFHHVAFIRDSQDSSESERERLSKRFLAHKKNGAVKYMRQVKRKVANKV
jgi:phospholipase C